MIVFQKVITATGSAGTHKSAISLIGDDDGKVYWTINHYEARNDITSSFIITDAVAQIILDNTESALESKT